MTATPLPLPALRERLLARPTRALVIVPSDGPKARQPTATRVLREHFPDAERHTPGRAYYPNGSTVRVVVAPFRPLDIAGLDLDVAVVLAPLSMAELYEVRARLLRNGGELVAPLAPVEAPMPTDPIRDALASTLARGEPDHVVAHRANGDPITTSQMLALLDTPGDSDAEEYVRSVTAAAVRLVGVRARRAGDAD